MEYVREEEKWITKKRKNRKSTGWDEFMSVVKNKIGKISIAFVEVNKKKKQIKHTFGILYLYINGNWKLCRIFFFGLTCVVFFSESKFVVFLLFYLSKKNTESQVSELVNTYNAFTAVLKYDMYSRCDQIQMNK